MILLVCNECFYFFFFFFFKQKTAYEMELCWSSDVCSSDLEFVACRDAAQEHGITCFATAFDERSADFLMQLGVPAFKIHSGGLTDEALVRYVAQFGKPVRSEERRVGKECRGRWVPSEVEKK